MSMEIVIKLVRELGAPTVGVYSEDPAIYVVRDASVSDRALLVAYAEALAEHQSEAVTV
jgi:hypothetical protein